MSHIAVLGAGSWGTALAKLLADRGTEVRLWSRGSQLAQHINEQGENARYLPGFALPEALTCVSDVATAVHGARSVYFVVPSHGLRGVAREAAPHLRDDALIVSASKGIENETLALMTDVLEQEIPTHAPNRLCVLGGPSFALEVAANLPTVVCVASKYRDMSTAIQEELSYDRFRVYTTDDVIGIELGGALKNVIAIAVGAADGLGFGHNARAGLITRGIAEITRLAVHLGGHPQTLAGLGGIGDLVLTCTGDLSRNRRVGIALGQGRGLEEVLNETTMIAEGVKTARSAHYLGVQEGVELPITNEVYAALYQGKSPLEAMESLLSRALRPERDA